MVKDNINYLIKEGFNPHAPLKYGDEYTLYGIDHAISSGDPEIVKIYILMVIKNL